MSQVPNNQPSDEMKTAMEKWLGIMPDDHPVSHYRLLGIQELASDPETIENAADQRMLFLRQKGSGQQKTIAENLLNQVSKARMTLLNAERKAAYDETLASKADTAVRGSAPVIGYNPDLQVQPEPKKSGININSPKASGKSGINFNGPQAQTPQAKAPQPLSPQVKAPQPQNPQGKINAPLGNTPQRPKPATTAVRPKGSPAKKQSQKNKLLPLVGGGVALLLLVVLVAAFSGGSDQPAGKKADKICSCQFVDANNRPVINKTVQLSCQSGQLASAQTNSRGQCTFTLPPDKCTHSKYSVSVIGNTFPLTDFQNRNSWRLACRAAKAPVAPPKPPVAPVKPPVAPVRPPVAPAKPPVAPVAPGPVKLLAQWPFDKDATDAITGSNGALVGDAAIVTDAVRGKVLSLDGRDDCVKVPNNGTLELAGNLTAAAWIKIDDPNSKTWMRIFSNKASQYSTSGFDLQYNPSENVFAARGGGENLAKTKPSYDLKSEWNHVAIAINGETVQMFLNGVEMEMKDNTIDPVLVSDEPLIIGDQVDDKDNYFQGRIDDLRVFNQAITPAQVAMLVKATTAKVVPKVEVAPKVVPTNAGTAKTDPNLLAHWAFDKDASDTVGGNDGTLKGDAVIVADPVRRGVLALDGKNGTCVSINDSGGLGPMTNLTAMAWIKLDDPNLQRYMRILSKKQKFDSATGCEITYNPKQNVIELRGSGGKKRAFTKGLRNLDTRWHHFAASVEGDTVRMFLDGLELAMEESKIEPIKTNDLPLMIGKPSGSGSGKDKNDLFQGRIDDVRLYGVALTPEQIQAVRRSSVE